MAKSKSKNSKSKAAKAAKNMEATTIDMAHKIWLAGVGAYGKAYDGARQSANTVNQQSAELFEDLVKRGEEIEDDVRSRLASDDRVSKAGEQVQKAFETAREIQEQARSQFESRMERMRDVLGVKGLGTISDKLHKQLDKLEDEVSALTSKAKKKGDEAVKARVERLLDEIETLSAKAGLTSPVKKTKVSKKNVKKAAAKKTTVKVPAKRIVADDLTLITGVGPAMQKRLAALGITKFSQIAAMTKAEAQTLDDKIEARGRVVRDGWVKQAKVLAK